MLSPKRVKHRKQMRRVGTSLKKKAHRGNRIAFGDYGLVSTESEWVSARQLEAARVAMTRHVKRGGKVWIRVFPDVPYTKKPAETRMGKGKGSPESWVAVIKPGTVMFELAGVSQELAQEAMKRAASKLPVQCKFAVREV